MNNFLTSLCMILVLFAIPLMGDSVSVRNKRSASIQRNTEASQLTWSKHELDEISRFTEGSFYYGEEATESRFKNEAGNFNILHIASHTFVNDYDPDLSYILFSAGDKKEDGKLNVFEIYNQKIKAGMIILSSCNTGLGKIINGEGTLSLARAFMYAGCPSIIMSLWDIDDRATSEIIVKFYQNLAVGRSKDQSLRESKLSYLKEADQFTANPLFWGGLVSIGNQSGLNIHPVSPNWGFPLVIYLSGLTVLLLLYKIIRTKHQISRVQNQE